MALAPICRSAKPNGSSYINGDGFVDYTIIVSNPGPTALVGARVQDPIALGFKGAAWICTGLNNAYCQSSGSGALDIQVDLPVLRGQETAWVGHAAQLSSD